MSQVFILLHLFICDAYTFFGCFPFLKHLYQINTMAFFFRGPPHHLSLPPILSLAQSRRHFLLIERFAFHTLLIVKAYNGNSGVIVERRRIGQCDNTQKINKVQQRHPIYLPSTQYTIAHSYG